MGNTRNAFTLLLGSGGHQRAGADKENFVKLPSAHLLKDYGAEDCSAAPAA